MREKTDSHSAYLLSETGMERLRDVYRDGLLQDTVPFWIRHCVDREQGGFIFNLDRDGTIIDTDKAMWIHGRFVWLLSVLCREVEPREEWLALARHGIEFIERYGFDRDGKMFFQVTREGEPLRMRRYLFTETFAVIAFAAYGAATGEKEYVRKAYDLYHFIEQYRPERESMLPKVNPSVRPAKGIGLPMQKINMLQVLRASGDDGSCTARIDLLVEEIVRDFIKEEQGWILETVGPDGEFIDHFEGRQIAPGHLIEVAWFILHEARVRGGDAGLIRLGCRILDWAWEAGWDEEYGGIIYYRDVKGTHPAEYWHDMKFWWPQNEAVIAALLAYRLTGDTGYARWHRMIHDWTYARFPDPDHGEWFGYLHRDGRISSTLKGTLWKGPFHLPRMQLYCWKLLDEMLAKPEKGRA